MFFPGFFSLISAVPGVNVCRLNGRGAMALVSSRGWAGLCLLSGFWNVGLSWLLKTL